MQGQKALVVLTGKSRERLLRNGGTSSWVLDPAIVRNFEFVVCVRHGHPPYDPGPGARPEPHGAAFLVAKISDLKVIDHYKGRDRYLVTFGAVAEVLIPNFWDGSRNPVRYIEVDEIKARGLDFETLEFEPFASIEVDNTEEEQGNEADVVPLTISEAKLALAANYKLPPDQIEITIRG